MPIRLSIGSRETHPIYYNFYVDQQDFADRAGAKLMGLVDLCAHYMTHDYIDPPVYIRGVETEWPDAPNTHNPTMRKIVVWHEFTMMAGLIASVSLPLSRYCITAC